MNHGLEGHGGGDIGMEQAILMVRIQYRSDGICISLQTSPMTRRVENEWLREVRGLCDGSRTTVVGLYAD